MINLRNRSSFFLLKNDITIPGAMEIQVDKVLAKKMDTQLVVEAANGPVNFEADKIFFIEILLLYLIF